MVISKLEYSLIDETKCGDEPLHILISDMKEKDFNQFFKSLVHLIELDYLQCLSGKHATSKPLKVTLADLNSYLDKRVRAKEHLEEYPECCPEYYFYATEKGVSQLKKEDRPIPTKQVKP